MTPLLVTLSLSRAFHCFFFLMIRRPPRSTLFPTRRSSDLGALTDRLIVVEGAEFVAGCDLPRSEEHTSELQSPVHLVCRLLLEKKNHRPRLAEPRGARLGRRGLPGR